MSAAPVWQDLPGELREGLARDELLLLYQPQVDMPTGRVVGAEALCRWQHPRHGLLQPADFLPALGAHPLGMDLADWAIAQAVDRLAAWTAEGRALSVSVNIGVAQLAHAELPLRLGAHLRRLAASASARLELELLETSAIEDFGPVAEGIDACRRLGVGVALDDFGTGHATLAWLRSLPVSALKIDQSFVAGLPESATDTAIVRHLVALARELGLTVVAEGVESLAHGEALMALGCRVGQGFAIAHPLPAAQFLPWLHHYERAPRWPQPG